LRIKAFFPEEAAILSFQFAVFSRTPYLHVMICNFVQPLFPGETAIDQLGEIVKVRKCYYRGLILDFAT